MSDGPERMSDVLEDTNEGFEPPPEPFHYVGPGKQGSIKPHHDFSDAHVETTCKDLRKAFRGIGSDEFRIIKILSEHNNEQRQQVATTYKTCFGSDLVEDLKDELSGNFEELCVALLVPPRKYDAICTHRAMEGAGTNEDWLIEILCACDNNEMKELREEYQKLYGKEMEKDIESETSGVFQKVLLSISQGNRDETDAANVDVKQAKQDARDLYDAGEGKLGTDEETFNLIFARRSFAHLREVFREYKNQVAHKDIEDSIKSEFSFDAEKAFLAIVQYAKDPQMYLAERLDNAMRGITDDRSSFIRLIVQHSEVDLGTVKDKFRGKFNITLEQFTRNETCGDWRKLACRVIEPTCSIR